MAIEIRIRKQYWVLQRTDLASCTILELTEFDNALDMREFISDAVVSAGEEGKSDNIVSQSHMPVELDSIIDVDRGA